MRKFICTILAICCAAASAQSAMAQVPAGQPDTGRAMTIAATYRPAGPSRRTAIFLSGDGGWNLGVVSMAQAMAHEGYTVVGVDFPAYLRSRDSAGAGCIPLASDLIATARSLSSPANRQVAPTPLLIGYSSGATAVYGALAEASPGTFVGGVSLGFGPDLMTKRPLCEGAGLTGRADPRLGYIYEPRQQLSAPWIALQGEIDQVVSPVVTRDFTAHIRNARAVMLPRVGHGFSVERNWMPQFRAAVAELETARTH